LLGLGYATGWVDWLGEHIFEVIGEKSGEDRIELLFMGLDALAKYPILGIGVRNIERISAYPEGWPVHNAFLQMASETGLLGGLSFIALVGLVMVRIGVLATSITEQAGKSLIKGLFIGYVVMVIDFMVEPFADNMVSWLYIGITASA